MGSFKPGTVWQEGNVNNSMILKMNADKKPWPGIYIKSRFGIVLIQKMKEEIIAMLFAAFYNLLPFFRLLNIDPEGSFQDRRSSFFCCTDSL